MKCEKDILWLVIIFIRLLCSTVYLLATSTRVQVHVLLLDYIQLGMFVGPLFVFCPDAILRTKPLRWLPTVQFDRYGIECNVLLVCFGAAITGTL
jgi:hypothetical protein